MHPPPPHAALAVARVGGHIELLDAATGVQLCSLKPLASKAKGAEAAEALLVRGLSFFSRDSSSSNGTAGCGERSGGAGWGAAVATAQQGVVAGGGGGV